MGINTFYIGKGIILPEEAIMEIISHDKTIPAGFQAQDELVVKYFQSKGIDAVQLGHDAFCAREGHTMEDIFGEASDDYAKSYSEICGRDSLYFIGTYTDLSDGGEYNYYVPTSELLYSLPVRLPQMLKEYTRLSLL